MVMYGMTPRQQWRDFRTGIRWRRNRQEAVVGDHPHLDDAGLEHFGKALAQARVYLEYGAGGSTVQASRTADVVISAETDPDYLDAVRRAVGDAPAQMVYCHADIGTTVEWGIPLVKIGTAKQRVLWAGYPWIPWDAPGSQVPDLVMVDGRFRVASAAASMLRAPDVRILFDDYLDRPFYWSIDAVADRVAEAGRLVEFRRKDAVSDEDMMRVVQAFVGDWR